MRTLGEWLEGAEQRISRLDAEIIAINVFPSETVDRSWLITHQDYLLADECWNQAEELLEKREIGVPLAYILHRKEFYGREFRVDKGVLIPRPETETLIDLVKELDLPARPRFLEIGTGSGCIAITLALEFPQSEVLATDISVAAFEVAKYNNICYEGRVEFWESDLFEYLEPKEIGQIDVIVANLPYVDPSWEWLDTSALGHEPVEALYAVGENGLAIYHRFFRELSEKAEGFGVKYCVLEADPCQHKELKALAKKYGWQHNKTQGFGLVFECAEGSK